MTSRARDLGVPFEGMTGAWNAITDVPGVEVGQITVQPDASVPASERHWVRTGVSAILPRGRNDRRPVYAGTAVLNGNGEFTGFAWIEEAGTLEGPVLLTNTDTVGLVRDAVVRWMRDHGFAPERWALPVVGETWDGYLNDVAGRHLREEHVFAALEGARSGPVEEGNVGSGTSAICYGYKGGIGTSSRIVGADPAYRLGVLVQANHGRPGQLRIPGVPFGRIGRGAAEFDKEVGSILMLVATDAPVLPHQLERIARRASLGLARTGSTSGNGSGDFALAWTTAGGPASRTAERPPVLANDDLDPLFEATVQATEEAILNALSAGSTMVGYRDRRVERAPIEDWLAGR
jgi:D-aminopeptidase